jgi:hypothetical protein
MKHSIAKQNAITYQYVRSILSYNQRTGIFKWKINRRTANRWDVAGWKELSGYWSICINNKAYLAHRLAWLYMTGEWPSNDIDHINGIKDDNRWRNLRQVTKSVNLQNQYSSQKGSAVPYLGVSIHGSKYRARIQLNNKHIILGSFSTPEEAHQEYLKAKRQYHEGCML